MRIIAGSARGRRLQSPATTNTRPTEDRVREAIFSILGDIHGAYVVDCFGGSGALGLEALSRGASEAVFFDTSRQAVQVINENIRRVGVEDRAVVFRLSFFKGLRDLLEGTPDLWFVDPPYGSDLVGKTLEALARAEDRVTQDALVVVEMPKEEQLPQFPQFIVEDCRVYGSTQVVFLRRR